MPLGTLERTPPPFFKQGPSALSKLLLLGSLAVLLMVTDHRFALNQGVRAVVMTALAPLQWLVLLPVRLGESASARLQSLQDAQRRAEDAARALVAQSLRAAQVEELSLENQRLRALLGLRQRLSVPAVAAQVLYDAADPYAQRVVIDQGLNAGIVLGSPVLDEAGVLGQVTRVHPLVSEVTLLTDRDQAIPVLNTRTGVRSVAYGVLSRGAPVLELRFMSGHADVQEGDLLATSGVDAVYPPGLPVARVVSVQRQADSAFARVRCAPVARTEAARHVLVLAPTGPQLPAPPPAAETKPTGKTATPAPRTPGPRPADARAPSDPTPEASP